MDDMSELELTGLEEEYVVKVRGLIGWTVVSLPKMGSQKFEGRSRVGKIRNVGLNQHF